MLQPYIPYKFMLNTFKAFQHFPAQALKTPTAAREMAQVLGVSRPWPDKRNKCFLFGCCLSFRAVSMTKHLLAPSAEAV